MGDGASIDAAARWENASLSAAMSIPRDPLRQLPIRRPARHGLGFDAVISYTAIYYECTLIYYNMYVYHAYVNTLHSRLEPEDHDHTTSSDISATR